MTTVITEHDKKFEGDGTEDTDVRDTEPLDSHWDVSERQAALDIQRSFIVQAPAGSGKTTLLIQRLLALLAQGVATPEECLCITFTRKAAREMQERVINALEYASQKDLPESGYDKNTFYLAKKLLEKDHQLGWDLIQQPHRMRIQTIDALCAELAHKMPLTSQVGAGMRLAEDARPLYEEAAANVVRQLESESFSEHIQTLLRHLDNDWQSAERLLADMLSQRDQWLLALGANFFAKPNREKLENGLKSVIKETVDLAEKTMPEKHKAELLELLSFAEQRNLSQSRIPSILSTIDSQESSFSFWQRLANLLLTENFDFRKTVTERQGFPAPSSTQDKQEKALFKQMKERMTTLLKTLSETEEEAFRQALQCLRECPPPVYTESQWKMVEALVALLPLLLAELLLVFQKKGQVDFIEVALAAHQALGSPEMPTDIALKLGYKIRHILVDEFQDTSLAQFMLIEKLTLTWSPLEGNTLFLVGDPMQSIYRFRRADVGLFLKAREQGVNEIKLNSLHLSCNFRSDPRIVEWINRNFSNLFPKKDCPEWGAVKYTSVCSTRRSENSAEVSLESVTEESEAQAIIECLLKLQREHSLGSRALLVRSRSHLSSLIPLLEKNNIPWNGVDLERLVTRPMIQDLLSLTRALIHLGDRVAWLSLLRSPLCNIPLGDIEVLATAQEDLPIFWALKHFSALDLDISIKAKDLLKIMVPILETALRERERLPFATWIKNTWMKLVFHSEQNLCQKTIYHILEEDPVFQDAKTFFNLLRTLAKDRDVFEIGILEQKIQGLYASKTTNDPNILQIMTIHKAKGLEFDTVLIAGLGRKERYDDSKLLLWEEGRTTEGYPYMVLAPIRSFGAKNDPIYEWLRKQEQRRARFESLRLLYVAATRAKKSLFGFVHRNQWWEVC